MKRPLKAASETRPGYPGLAVARRILLAGSILVAGAAAADTTPPPTGNDGNRPVVIRPGGKPPLPSTKGDQPRPQPPRHLAGKKVAPERLKIG